MKEVDQYQGDESDSVVKAYVKDINIPYADPPKVFDFNVLSQETKRDIYGYFFRRRYT